MSRSRWKGPIVFNTNSNQLTSKKKIPIFKRNAEIMPAVIGSIIAVHCGNKMIKLTISKSMVGHKVGEFILTRKQAFFKKKKK